MFVWLHSWQWVSNAIPWSFCRWERGSGDGKVDFSYCCFTLQGCCRRGVDAEQGTEMRPFRLTAKTDHCCLPRPFKAYTVSRPVPTDFTHGVSSSSHEFRIQSHLFTCDSHVCDCVFQAHANNIWSILRSYDPHKPTCPKPSVSVPIGFLIVWNLILFFSPPE